MTPYPTDPAFEKLLSGNRVVKCRHCGKLHSDRIHGRVCLTCLRAYRAERARLNRVRSNQRAKERRLLAGPPQTPSGDLRESVLRRFDSKWEAVTETGCWLWTGSTDMRGYGRLNTRHRPEVAPRVSWMLRKGDIPPGMCICHKCDTPACVNPDHLFLGTHADNNRDMRNKGRYVAIPVARGEDCHLTKLTTEQVLRIRGDIRIGREIAKDYGVSTAAIYAIQNRKTWRHLP